MDPALSLDSKSIYMTTWSRCLQVWSAKNRTFFVRRSIVAWREASYDGLVSANGFCSGCKVLHEFLNWNFFLQQIIYDVLAPSFLFANKNLDPTFIYIYITCIVWYQFSSMIEVKEWRGGRCELDSLDGVPRICGTFVSSLVQTFHIKFM